ncbi:hypothetical protein [Acinetobacter sp. ANC 4558]|nr:hypothetical protein [Acinetobacter sp. ANC 4558]
MINTISLFKIGLSIGIFSLFAIAFILWFQTPNLFEYFNQAFCAH